MRRVDVGLGARTYPVMVGGGLVSRAGELIAPLLKRPRVAVVSDQLGRPTWAQDCASGALRLVQALIDRDPSGRGIFHLSGAGDATWADFAEAIFEESALRAGSRPQVRRIATADYPTPAVRPANSRLDCSKILRALDWPTRPWREGLKACFTELETQGT